ncbi:hypothetical protein AOLI_G00162510 [Acnodon oligacanthus]
MTVLFGRLWFGRLHRHHITSRDLQQLPAQLRVTHSPCFPIRASRGFHTSASFFSQMDLELELVVRVRVDSAAAERFEGTAGPVRPEWGQTEQTLSKRSVKPPNAVGGREVLVNKDIKTQDIKDKDGKLQYTCLEAVSEGSALELACVVCSAEAEGDSVGS